MKKDHVWFFLQALVLIAAALWLLNKIGADLSQREGRPEVSSAAGAMRSISPAEAWRRLQAKEKITLLDVRTPAENAESRIPGSILIPLEPENRIPADAPRLLPDKSATIFVYCRSGRRSREAAATLVGMGYRNVYDLGGIANWPYVKESGPAAP